jgi:S-adenosylmethionine synthetase
MSHFARSLISPFCGRQYAEYVSVGHPDRIADIISDAILDAVLQINRDARVAIETAIKDHDVWIFGEMSGVEALDVEQIVHDVLQDVGYADERWGLDLDALRVRSTITEQSPDIAAGLLRSGRLGAGDQAVVYGHATSEVAGLPTPFTMARRIIRALSFARRHRPELGPDAKALVGVDYSCGRPDRIASIVVSSQHAPDVNVSTVRDIVYEEVLLPALGDLIQDAEVLINPAGAFVVGGPIGDAGLTGRKVAIDTYGGLARHGGGALSGKDATKVDRFAAYAARDLALQFLRAWEARVAEIRIAYAIGRPTPLSLQIATDTAGEFEWRPRQHWTDEVMERLTPEAVIDLFDLKAPIYRDLAINGHFGRGDLPWECNRVRSAPHNQPHDARALESAEAPAPAPERPADALIH